MSINDTALALAESISVNASTSENNIRTKFPANNLFINFPTCPIPQEQMIVFTGFIKEVSDSYTPSYDPKSVYGRMDAIPVYQRTSRKVSFSLDIPSNGLAHSRDLAKSMNILVKNLYPSYQANGSVNVISSPPLVKMFFSNIIFNNWNKAGVLGYFDSAITIKHDLGNGVFVRAGGFEMYAKAYNISFSFTVLHDFTPGYINTNGSIVNPVHILDSRP